MVFILRCPGHSLATGTLLVEYQIHIIPPLTSDPCAHIPFQGCNPGRQLLRPTGPRILSVLHYFRSPVSGLRTPDPGIRPDRDSTARGPEGPLSRRDRRRAWGSARAGSGEGGGVLEFYLHSKAGQEK